MVNNELTPEQKKQQEEYLREELAKGVAFEAFKHSEAYKYLQAYYENVVKNFTNKAILTGFKDMEEYREERGKVLGIKVMFEGIQSSLITLAEQRQKNKDNENEQTE